MEVNLDSVLKDLSPGALILDAGGWFQPLRRATHVVDLMPYETRRGHLSESPEEEEYFSKQTWFQVEFCSSELRLPFADKFFDLCVCTQTIEDLRDPIPLLQEIRRVARAGYFESPSRLAEQTVGVKDRISSTQGHDHHCWILDVVGNCLELSPKAASLSPGRHGHRIPLCIYEREVQTRRTASRANLHWTETFDWRIASDTEAEQRALKFARVLEFSRYTSAIDGARRFLRGLKWRKSQQAQPSAEVWWAEMLQLSRPFTNIPL